MKISSAAKTALTGAVREAFSGSISVYEVGAQETEWQVNWSALGAQPAEVAEAFADNLRLAAQITFLLNIEHVRVDYDLENEFADREEISRTAADAAELIKAGHTGAAMWRLFGKGQEKQETEGRK